MKGCFAGRKPVGKPRCRWWDAISRDIVALPKIWNCGVAEMKRQSCRKKFRGCLGQQTGRRDLQEETDVIYVIKLHMKI